MAAIDIKTDLDTQAWALLEASSAFNAAFPVGSRLKDDVRAITKNAVQRTPGVFPQISIVVIADAQTPENPPLTFGMNSATPTASFPDGPRPCTARIVVTMAFDQSQPKAARFAAESAVRAVWESVWPKFGIQYVKDFSRTSQQQKKPWPTNDKTERIVVTQTLNFRLRPLRSQLF